MPPSYNGGGSGNLTYTADCSETWANFDGDLLELSGTPNFVGVTRCVIWAHSFLGKNSSNDLNITSFDAVPQWLSPIPNVVGNASDVLQIIVSDKNSTIFDPDNFPVPVNVTHIDGSPFVAW